VDGRVIVAVGQEVLLQGSNEGAAGGGEGGASDERIRWMAASKGDERMGKRRKWSRIIESVLATACLPRFKGTLLTLCNQ